MKSSGKSGVRPHETRWLERAAKKAQHLHLQGQNMAKRKRNCSRGASRSVKKRDAPLQAWQGQERPGRQGEKPEASHRHRPVESPQEGQEGSEEKVLMPRHLVPPRRGEEPPLADAVESTTTPRSRSCPNLPRSDVPPSAARRPKAGPSRKDRPQGSAQQNDEAIRPAASWAAALPDALSCSTPEKARE
jgi:hypothetical protein